MREVTYGRGGFDSSSPERNIVDERDLPPRPPSLDLEKFGPVSGDVTTALQSAFDHVAVRGGIVSLPQVAELTISDTITLTRTAFTDWVVMEGNYARITWAGGAAPMFAFAGSDGAGSGFDRRDTVVRNLRLWGENKATAGFHWVDANHALFDDIHVRFLGGPAFRLESTAGKQSENCEFSRIVVRNCDSVAAYSGRARLRSFARARWDVFAGGIPTWFDIGPDARPYDSRFTVRGNMSTDSTLFVWRSKNCESTVIDAAAETGGSTGCAIFDRDGADVGLPKLAHAELLDADIALERVANPAR